MAYWLSEKTETGPGWVKLQKGDHSARLTVWVPGTLPLHLTFKFRVESNFLGSVNPKMPPLVSCKCIHNQAKADSAKLPRWTSQLPSTYIVQGTGRSGISVKLAGVWRVSSRYRISSGLKGTKGKVTHQGSGGLEN